jgi:alkanesulfonate monooxygenase SsuD/methylene tetrahydromethanopterin reductase-like flavin-dependent oxidoreductase (luciferase family)
LKESSNVRIGHFQSSEEFDPREFVWQARMAEDAGFQGLWISDDHPWNEDAGSDELYIQQIGPDQERFFEIYANEMLPHFDDGESATSALTSAAA